METSTASGPLSTRTDHQSEARKAQHETDKTLYKLEISIKIVERSSYSDKIPEIAFSVRENIPSGVHPVDYLRQRLSEEVRRHASQTTLETRADITSSGEI